MRLAIFILIASVLNTGCSFLSTSSWEINRSEDKWNSMGIKDYNYTFVIASLNPEVECAELGHGIEVQVRDGKVAKFGSCSLDVENARLYGTINSVFAALRNEKAEGAVSVRVVFNEYYAYPESMDINYSRWFTDHRVQYYISDFRTENE